MEEGVKVLEIGSILREARIRHGVELAQVEASTHIRTRYLKALEDERFDLLPGEAYACGFLRTYADYLELDADLFVDEYKARFAPPEEPLPQLIPRRRIDLPRLSALVTVGALLAVALVVVLAWRLEGGEPTEPAATGGPALTGGTALGMAPAAPVRGIRRARREAQPARLVLTAAYGPCWLRVQLGSPAGRYVHEGTLEQGQSLRFAGPRLWIRLGAPSNLEASLNGARTSLPEDTATVVVTTAGVQTVEGG
ncbi:MAG TPA: RodZ domain-containing protein [Gaiellaceae bacterium]|nr:RodZ domain-containing protein [Gaiellaceae bacterium]